MVLNGTLKVTNKIKVYTDMNVNIRKQHQLCRKVKINQFHCKEVTRTMPTFNSPCKICTQKWS